MANLPVVERATRALVAQLATITATNGYDFTVNNVYRKRDIPERAEAPVEIHLLFGKTPIDSGYNTQQTSEKRTCYIWFIFRDTGAGDEDFQYNLFVANLQKCLGETVSNHSNVVDSSNPLRPFRVEIYQKEHLPRYAETRKGFVCGRLEIEYEYCYMHDDQFLWDHLDSHVAA